MGQFEIRFRRAGVLRQLVTIRTITAVKPTHQGPIRPAVRPLSEWPTMRTQ